MDKPIKLIVVINGPGGVGKDTIVEVVSKHYDVMNVSSITPFKHIAEMCGVPPSKFKTGGGRKLLSDLKSLFTEYNDYPNRYLLNMVDQFNDDQKEIMFVHIREPEEIKKFKNSVIGVPVTTLLVTNGIQYIYGNDSDDSVMYYEYDYYYKNVGTIDDLETDFIPLFEKIIEEKTNGGA